VVLEVTEKKNLDRPLSYVIGNLLHAGATLKTELQRRKEKGAAPYEQTILLVRAIEPLEQSMGRRKRSAKRRGPTLS
jgi:hypothetical protein